MIFTDQSFEFRWAHRFSPYDKNGFDHQQADLSMKLCDFCFIVPGFSDLVGKHHGHAINSVPFLCAHLSWVQLQLGRAPLNRHVTTQCIKYYSGFSFI